MTTKFKAGDVVYDAELNTIWVVREVTYILWVQMGEPLFSHGEKIYDSITSIDPTNVIKIGEL